MVGEAAPAGVRPMAAPPPLPEPQIVPESAPQIAPGGGFLERLGLALAQSPPQYQSRGPERGADDFIGNLLSSAAGTFGQGTARAVGEREAVNAAQRAAAAERNRGNIEATEAGRKLAQSRWDKLRAESAEARKYERELQPAPPELVQRGYAPRMRPEDTKRAMETLFPERFRSQGGSGGAQSDAAAEMAEMFVRGEIEWTGIPFGLRGTAAEYLKTTGQRGKPKKEREADATLAEAMSVIDTLESLSKGVQRVEDPGPLGIYRATRGAQNIVGATTQTDPNAAQFNATLQGFLAFIARASGERGVLTDQDVMRARQNLPSLTDSQELADSKIRTLRGIFQQAASRKKAAFTSRGTLGAAPPRSAPQVPEGFVPDE